jgi:hypothetical protein
MPRRFHAGSSCASSSMALERDAIAPAKSLRRSCSCPRMSAAMAGGASSLATAGGGGGGGAGTAVDAGAGRGSVGEGAGGSAGSEGSAATGTGTEAGAGGCTGGAGGGGGAVRSSRCAKSAPGTRRPIASASTATPPLPGSGARFVTTKGAGFTGRGRSRTWVCGRPGSRGRTPAVEEGAAGRPEASLSRSFTASAAFGGRSSGSFAMSWRHARSTGTGISGTRARGGSGGVVRTSARVASGVVEWKGRTPVSIS